MKKGMYYFFFYNCLAHLKILQKTLNAIKIIFFPTNMTSKLQPMDQSLIKNLKHHYRKKIMQRYLRKLELDEAIRDVNLLDCIHMLYSSRESFSTSTIYNCCKKQDSEN